VCWEAGRKPGGLGLGFEIKAGLFEKRLYFSGILWTYF